MPIPATFHDGISINPFDFFLHDKKHAHGIQLQNKGDDYESKKIVYDKIQSITKTLTDEPNVVAALTLLFFIYTHECPCIISRLSSEGFNPYLTDEFNETILKQIKTSIIDGFFNNENISIEDIIKAYAVLREEFPVKSSPLPQKT